MITYHNRFINTTQWIYFSNPISLVHAVKIGEVTRWFAPNYFMMCAFTAFDKALFNRYLEWIFQPFS